MSQYISNQNINSCQTKGQMFYQSVCMSDVLSMNVSRANVGICVRIHDVSEYNLKIEGF